MICFQNQPIPFDTNYHRYCPDRDFPPYRYIPGFSPHPITDPQGHSYRKKNDQFPTITCQNNSPGNWRKNRQYLYGVDLFNFSYWWEAHEAWEHDWNRTKGDQKIFLQGLIQICAAMIKQHVCQWRGTTNLSNRGCAKLAQIQSNFPVYMGLDLNHFLYQLDVFFRSVIHFGVFNQSTNDHPPVQLPLIRLVYSQ